MTTTYRYNNGMLLSETTGDETIYYYYDSTGKVAGIGYRKGSDTETGYFFTRNAQGDIIAIYRNSDSKLIGTYEYDLWGRPVSVKEASAGVDTDGILTKNPLRYRGYYYDNETGFYYLNARYYDPEVRRFISADSLAYLGVNKSVTSYNLFAYCGNNPVIRVDTNGNFWHIIVGAVVGVAAQYVSDVVTNLVEGKSFTEALKPTSTWADYGAAALSGALAATGIGLGASVAANAAIGGATYLVNCSIKGEDANIIDLGLATGAGAISGLVGGSGADGARLRGVTRTSKDALKTAVSPKKIAMYSSKIVECKEIAIISGLRTMGAGFSANWINAKRRGITHSEI